MRLNWVRMGPNPMIDVLINGEIWTKSHEKGRDAHEDRGRYWSETEIGAMRLSAREPKDRQRPQKDEERQEGSSLRA